MTAPHVPHDQHVPYDTVASSDGEPDRLTPRCHVRPPSGWANDPNGPIRWGDTYHLFYQHNPHAPVHDLIHWGHASSPDLAHWEHHPIALSPTPGGPDGYGCWSGCAVDDDGTPTAVYTGARADDGQGAICLAYGDGDRLTEWRIDPKPVVAGPPPELDLAVFRDPFVFHHAGRRWALVGAGHRDGTPSVVLYDCADLHDWKYAGVFLDGRDPVAGPLAPGTGWECPQLFHDGDDWVLVLSLWADAPLGRVAYLTGDLEPSGDGMRFRPRLGGAVDHGNDFYAPAVLQEDDRALLWGWSWESRPQDEVDAAGWAGLLTFPRVLGTHPDGSLRCAPAPELIALRAPEPFVDTELAPGGSEPTPGGSEKTPGGAASAVDLAALPAGYELLIRTETTLTAELLRGAGGERLTLRLDPAAGRLLLDRSGWPAEAAWKTVVERPATLTAELPPTDGPMTVRVLVDGPVLEIFADDRVALTERVYARPGDTARLAVAVGEDGPAEDGPDAEGRDPAAAAWITGWELVPAPPKNG